MIQNAKIKSTFIGFEDHGFLTSWLSLELDGSRQGFGGFNLKGDFTDRWIKRILEVLEKNSWEELKGTVVRVDGDFDKIYGIGHFINDKWFYPSREASHERD
jgi:hypothetical protein